MSEQLDKSTSLVTFWKNEAERLKAELAFLRQCSTCCGTPHASGLPCICGGTNKAEDEVKNLRLESMVLRRQNNEYHASADANGQTALMSRAAEMERMWHEATERAERAETVIQMAGNWPQTLSTLEAALSTFPAGRAFLSRWGADEKRASEAFGRAHAAEHERDELREALQQVEAIIAAIPFGPGAYEALHVARFALASTSKT